ncbi:hypothetical protein M407DRAFT_242716 [Tulasnella calospora MUT 4182]|uniref:Uncharacterized protein n=1 Tax=Tulasnella calospora MUT 4182 TaxID=1051891 RepID=A0A0C3QDL2_9AGAM|nr:hypothetical protein M407DRAFT_242716 [Tulasnella calospora MUT 4182]
MVVAAKAYNGSRCISKVRRQNRDRGPAAEETGRKGAKCVIYEGGQEWVEGQVEKKGAALSYFWRKPSAWKAQEYKRIEEKKVIGEAKKIIQSEVGGSDRAMGKGEKTKRSTHKLEGIVMPLKESSP